MHYSIRNYTVFNLKEAPLIIRLYKTIALLENAYICVKRVKYCLIVVKFGYKGNMPGCFGWRVRQKTYGTLKIGSRLLKRNTYIFNKIIEKYDVAIFSGL